MSLLKSGEVRKAKLIKEEIWEWIDFSKEIKEWFLNLLENWQIDEAKEVKEEFWEWIDFEVTMKQEFQSNIEDYMTSQEKLDWYNHLLNLFWYNFVFNNLLKNIEFWENTHDNLLFVQSLQSKSAEDQKFIVNLILKISCLKQLIILS